jgi:hypothetical protein
MCRRTKELPFAAGFGRGRTMGAGWCTTGQPGGRFAQRRRWIAQGDDPAVVRSPESTEDELAELKKQYQEMSASLARIAGKIESLEAKAAGK